MATQPESLVPTALLDDPGLVAAVPKVAYLPRPALPWDVRPFVDARRISDCWDRFLNNDPIMAEMVKKQDSAFWEIGDMEGIYYLYDIILGVRANFGIKVWSTRFLGEAGIATHLKMRDYLFDAYDLKRLGATIDIHNKTCIALTESLGFELEGTHRNWGYIKGNLTDVHTYALYSKVT